MNSVNAYPVSPMQKGMLFHALSARQPGVDIEQVRCLLCAEINDEAFVRAWQHVADRHEALRSSFNLDQPGDPVQESRPQVEICFVKKDWRGISAPEQQTRLQAFLQADRQNGFNLARPPLMRVTLFQMGEADYQFVWTFHHLLLDGRSIGLVLDEVLTLHEAYSQGVAVDLKPVRPFRDFINWLQGQNPAASEAFWRQQLAGFRAPTPLVIGRKLSESEQGFEGEQQIEVTADTTATLRNLAKKYRLTLNTFAQGAWALLLSHYSGEDDVVFGAVRAGRHATVEGAESIVGLFINTQPMRVRLGADTKLIPWLEELRSTWIEMRKHKHTPLVEIQGWSDVSRDAQLFETILNFQDPAWHDVLRARGGSWSSRQFCLYSQSNYPLAVDISAGEQLTIKLLYHRARFEDATIARMLGHFKTLLEGMAENPDRRLGELPLLTPAEKQQVLVEWNQTREELTVDRCVHELFEAQAARTPGALAVRDTRQELTYEALNRLADGLAVHLRGLGIGPDVCAAVCMERSAEMVVTLLGILKAGGAYVPLDPDCPQDRIAFMVKDAGVRVLLVPSHRRNHFRTIFTDVKIVSPEELSPAPAAATPGPRPNPRNLAYVIYTSGSTGIPKGVEIEHRSLVNLVTWHQKTFSLTPADRATQLAAPAFDASVWELWPYLTAGASIHIPENEIRISPGKLVSWLAENQISLSFAPTPLAEAMLRELWPENSALRGLLTGGDKLHRAPGEDFPSTLYNFYGPTENTVVTSGAAVLPGNHSAAPHIGRPISNVRVYVLDRWQCPTPVGVPGELCIAGIGLARGYRHRPDLTAEKFVTDPFASNPDDRMYRTGDLVRYRSDGNLEYLGRMDGQLKIRGNRIELGEIETVLRQYPGVREVAADLRKQASGDNRLFAWIVAAPDEKPAANALRAYLKQKLPDYMVPSVFIPLKSLPLTPNGKVDRAILQVPKAEQSENYTAPATPVEEILAGIWSEVLGLDQVGTQDNFFDFGGHSLLATQVMARVRSKFHIELPLQSLFDAPTIISLAARIDAALREASAHSTPPLRRQTGEPAQCLSSAQERLWFLEQLEPGKAFNNIPLAIQLTGPLDIAALSRAFSEILARHKPLRTVYDTVNGSPVAMVLPVYPIELAAESLEMIPAPGRPLAADKVMAEEARKPFDLKHGPLVRLRLLRLGPEEHRLLFTTHHIACDGWSVGVLYRELASLYNAFSQGGLSPLRDLPVDYSDFAHWQRGWLQGEVLQKQLDYWKQQFQGELPVLNLTPDQPRPPVQTYHGSAHFFSLPPAVVTALNDLARREGVTMFMVLMGALQALLNRYSGQEDILIGTPIAGRTQEETEGLIGMFVNTLALRGDLSGNPTFIELAHRVRKKALAAYAHQDLPFEKLVDELKLQRDLSRPALFQVMFILQNEPMAPQELNGLRLQPLPTHNGTSKFDLTLSLEETATGLTGNVEYNTDLFLPGTIERFIGHYQALLENVAADPGQRLSELNLLPPAEREEVLYGYNQTGAAYPQDKCLHHLIEEQAGRTPDDIALVFDSAEISYRELNRRANTLAARLTALGVGPDVRVAICLRRSLEMVVGLLGILKAGGCYVPLDPTYPKDRLEFMLENSEAAVLLTQESLQAEFGFQLPRLQLLCLDAAQFFADGTAPSENRSVSGLCPSHLAYVIYTSGSTGRPKGVMLTHRNVVNFFAGMDEVLGVEPGVWLAVTSISFDISVLELFWTLSHGYRVVIQPDDDRIAAPNGAEPGRTNGQRRSVPEQIEWHRVTHLQCTPSLAGTLAMTSQSLEALRHLGKLLLGGEALPVALADQLRQHLGGDLINMYGPTETTVWSATHHVRDSQGSIPIGRPIANTQIYLLDKSLRPVPMGVPGEIFIAGDGVARGYLNRPELTAEKFLPDPFAKSGAGARMYRTGDLGRLLPDGAIDFLGRLDHQVKLRGFRIELSEIESVLRAQPEISDCVVKIWEAAPNDRRLVAYLVPAADKVLDDGALKRSLKERLPDYMVPAHFVSLAKLPLTPNGKVDRKALPEPTDSRPVMETAYVAPATKLEKDLATIWRDLLHVEKAGLNDNFFELGGHSLLMVRLQVKLKHDLGIDLPVVALFQYPTISSLTKFLTQKESPGGPARTTDRARQQREALGRRRPTEVTA